MNRILSPQKAGGAITMSCGGGSGEDGTIEVLNGNIVDSIHNPCIRSTVEKLANSNLQNTVTNILQNVFSISGKSKISFEEDPNSQYEGHNQGIIYGTNPTIIKETIYINPNLLTEASKEYTASIIIHEIIHAALNAEGMDSSLQHEAILYKYIDDMSATLRALYPQMTL